MRAAYVSFARSEGWPRVRTTVHIIRVSYTCRLVHYVDRKNHRNGIHRPRKQRFPSLKGVDPKFLRNMRFAKKKNKRVPRAPKATTSPTPQKTSATVETPKA
ncbi:unnamed protein product [Mesocestoides corti]|uniref:60S ribosomal protein L29 n=1 Tax=Mesocestoides corti TaxID=53468 RepID=A0A3P6HFB7_MESCO|nr:unnamed protein product [Mesocestoides corti]